MAIGASCPLLKSVIIEGLDLSISTDHIVTALAQGCRQLVSITLSHSNLNSYVVRQEITNASMSVLARCCPMLHTVYLGGCELITDLAILAIAQSCPLLNIFCTIDARQLTKACLIALGIGCPFLEEVSFPIGAQFEDAALHHFFTECPKLIIVEYRENCYFKQLPSGCPNLQYASIYSDDQCAQMGEECYRLEVVEIGHHYEMVCEVTDVGIQALARGSPLLADMRIWQSKAVTDEGICVLAQCCSLLHTIDLSTLR